MEGVAISQRLTSFNPSLEGVVKGETSPLVSLEGNRQLQGNCGMGRSSLDTCLRIIATENVIYTPATDINYRQKHANIEAMNYFLMTKNKQIQKQLADQCLSEWYGLDPDLSFDVRELPLDLAEIFNLRLTRYRNQCLLDFAGYHFSKYVEGTRRKHSYLHVYRGDQHCLKLLENRYHNSYCRKIKNRMNYLVWKYGNENAVLLTLTIDPKMYGNDKLLMWRSVKKDFHKFMDALGHFLKQHGQAMPKYVHAIESQKNGNPHIHVVFFGSKRLCDWRKIRKYWGKGHTFINRTCQGKKVRYPVHYITKYITKTFANTNPKNVLTQSMIWLFNMRSFDHSKGLTIPLNPKSTGEWSVGGIAIIPTMRSQIDEMLVIQDVICSLFGGFKDPPPGA